MSSSKQWFVGLIIIAVLIGFYFFFFKPSEIAPEQQPSLNPESKRVFDSLDSLDSGLAGFANATDPEAVAELEDFSDYATFVEWLPQLSDSELSSLKTKLVEMDSDFKNQKKPIACLPVYEKTVELAQSFAENERFSLAHPLDAGFLAQDLCSQLDLIKQYNDLQQKNLQKMKELVQTVQAEYAADPATLVACNIQPPSIDFTPLEQELQQKQANYLTAVEQCRTIATVHLSDSKNTETAKQSIFFQAPSEEDLDTILPNIDHLDSVIQSGSYSRFWAQAAETIETEPTTGGRITSFVVDYAGARILPGTIVRAGTATGQLAVKLGPPIAQLGAWASRGTGLDVTVNAVRDARAAKKIAEAIAAAKKFKDVPKASLNPEIDAILQSTRTEYQTTKTALNTAKAGERITALGEFRNAKNALQAAQNMEKIAAAAGNAGKGGEILAMSAAKGESWAQMLKLASDGKKTKRVIEAIKGGKSVENALKLSRGLSIAGGVAEITKFAAWMAIVDVSVSAVANYIENSTFLEAPALDISELIEKSGGVGGEFTGMHSVILCTSRKETVRKYDDLSFPLVNLETSSRINFVDKALGQSVYLFSLRCLGPEEGYFKPATYANVRLDEVENGLSKLCAEKQTFDTKRLDFDSDKGHGDGPLLYSKWYPLKNPVTVSVYNKNDLCYRLTVLKAESGAAAITTGSIIPSSIAVEDVKIDFDEKIFNNISNLKKLVGDLSSVTNEKAIISTIRIQKADLLKVYGSWDTETMKKELAEPNKTKNSFPTLIIKRPLGKEGYVLFLPVVIEADGEVVEFTYMVPQIDKRYALVFFKNDQPLKEFVMGLRMDKAGSKEVPLPSLLEMR